MKVCGISTYVISVELTDFETLAPHVGPNLDLSACTEMSTIEQWTQDLISADVRVRTQTLTQLYTRLGTYSCC